MIAGTTPGRTISIGRVGCYRRDTYHFQCTSQQNVTRTAILSEYKRTLPEDVRGTPTGISGRNSPAFRRSERCRTAIQVVDSSRSRYRGEQLPHDLQFLLTDRNVVRSDDAVERGTIAGAHGSFAPAIWDRSRIRTTPRRSAHSVRGCVSSISNPLSIHFRRSRTCSRRKVGPPGFPTSHSESPPSSSKSSLSRNGRLRFSISSM